MSIESVREKYARKRQERDNHYAECLKESGVDDSPAMEAAYALAWDYGHASGVQEVWNYWADLVEVVKNAQREGARNV